MDKKTWKDLFSTARKARRAIQFTRGAEWWSVSSIGGGVSRLHTGSWTYNRPWRADHALALELTAHMRRKFRLTGGGGVDYARTLRLAQH
jgi:hypothetical protein